jgi:hypothetical protein
MNYIIDCDYQSRCKSSGRRFMMSCKLKHSGFNAHQKLPIDYSIYYSSGYDLIFEIFYLKMGLKSHNLIRFLVMKILETLGFV